MRSGGDAVPTSSSLLWMRTWEPMAIGVAASGNTPDELMLSTWPLIVSIAASFIFEQKAAPRTASECVLRVWRQVRLHSRLVRSSSRRCRSNSIVAGSRDKLLSGEVL